MKFRTFLPAFMLGLLLCSRVSAQEAAPASTPAEKEVVGELQAIVGQVRLKMEHGRPTAATLAPELARFDALLAKHAGEKTDIIATVALMKASLYLEVIQDEAKGRELLLAVKKDFAGTQPAGAVDQLLARIDQAAAAGKTQAALIGHAAPELHFQWSSKAGLKTLADLRGQVVVLDFWATWCGPCVASFPKVRDEVAHFADAPVTFVGVTSIQGQVNGLAAQPINTKGDPAKEISLMPQFIKANDMTWNVVISDEEVFNPAYGIEGIPFVAILAPDGTVRHAGLNPLDPNADIAGKVEAILKEFKLPVPKA